MSTIGKALALLDLISQIEGDVGLSDAARLGGLDKATARRLLVEMEKHGFIEQDAETRRYRIGSAPVRLARIREARYPFVGIAAPFAKMLAEAVGETVHISEFSGGRLATVHVEDSQQAHRVIVKVGSILPFHATASGLAFLAFAAPQTVEAVLAGPLERFSEHTAATPEKLRALLRETAERGFSLSRQGLEEGVISTAAAILAPNGKPVGTVAIAAPMVRANEETMLAFGARAVEAARGIAQKYYGTKTSEGNRSTMGEDAGGTTFGTTKNPRHRNG